MSFHPPDYRSIKNQLILGEKGFIKLYSILQGIFKPKIVLIIIIGKEGSTLSGRTNGPDQKKKQKIMNSPYLNPNPNSNPVTLTYSYYACQKYYHALF